MLTITVHPQDMEQSLVHSRTRTTYVWFQSFALFSHPPGLPSEDRVLEEFRGSRGLLWVDWSEKASWRKGDGSTKMSPRSPVPCLLIILSPNQVPLSPSDEMALNLSCTCFHLHLAYGRKELHSISPKTMASTFFSRHSQVFPGTSVLYPLPPPETPPAHMIHSLCPPDPAVPFRSSPSAPPGALSQPFLRTLSGSSPPVPTTWCLRTLLFSRLLAWSH